VFTAEEIGFAGNDDRGRLYCVHLLGRKPGLFKTGDDRWQETAFRTCAAALALLAQG
jgi:hypothetical protein